MPFIDDLKERPVTALFGHGSVNISVAQSCLLNDVMNGPIGCKEARIQLASFINQVMLPLQPEPEGFP